MDVQDISSRNAANVFPLAHLDQLIGAAGTRIFPELLFRELRTISGCAHLSTLLFANERPSQIMLAANEGPIELSRLTAQKYIVEYWKHDPANRLTKHLKAADLAARFAPGEIHEKHYRRDCYSTLDLVDRFSILRKRDKATMRLNVYRSRSSGRFSEGQVDKIVQASDLLFALVTKHHDLSKRQTATAETTRRRLLLIERRLTPRELDICTGIIAGQTSEAIALSLGLSVNTVLTYRKRAYARLNISTQNELIRLALQG